MAAKQYSEFNWNSSVNRVRTGSSSDWVLPLVSTEGGSDRGLAANHK